MQRAETILRVIQERGAAGQSLERLYRQLYNQHLYLAAYARLSIQRGASAPQVGPQVKSSGLLGQVARIVDLLRQERFRWAPGMDAGSEMPATWQGLPPLGEPTTEFSDDLLLQAVIRLLLEAYYEPRLSQYAHGYRLGRGSRTALAALKATGSAASWFITGELGSWFGRCDQAWLLDQLGTLGDGRFLRLMQQLLAAGSLQQWQPGAGLDETPVGSHVGCLLVELYLDRLDRFVEYELMPEYPWDAAGIHQPQVHLHRETAGPAASRLGYVRHAGSLVLAFSGTRAEAEAIRRRLADFLQLELGWCVAEEELPLHHARSEPITFVGYQIALQGRGAARRLALRIPPSALRRLCGRYLRQGKPVQLGRLKDLSDYAIVAHYQAAYTAAVDHYRLAQNLSQLGRLRWNMATSLLKTLASKHRSTAQQMAERYGSTIETVRGPMQGFRVVQERSGQRARVAEFGAVPLRTWKHKPESRVR